MDAFDVSDDITRASNDGVGGSGSLGAIYAHNEQQSTYLNLASGYRFPDLGERFQTALVRVVESQLALGNPDLEPERSYSAEIGTKGEWENWTYAAAAFYNYVHRHPIGKYLEMNKVGWRSV